MLFPRIGQDESTLRDVEGKARRVVEASSRGEGAIAVEARLAGSRHGRDDATDRVDPADPLVAGVGDVQVSLGVDREARGGIEGCEGGGTLVAVEAQVTGARHGRDDPTRVDPADPVVASVGDIQVSGDHRRLARTCR